MSAFVPPPPPPPSCSSLITPEGKAICKSKFIHHKLSEAEYTKGIIQIGTAELEKLNRDDGLPGGHESGLLIVCEPLLCPILQSGPTYGAYL